MQGRIRLDNAQPRMTPMPVRAPMTRRHPRRTTTGTGSVPVPSTLGGSHELPELVEQRDMAIDTLPTDT